MPTRSHLVAACALAILLTACAGSTDGTAAPDAPSAAEDPTEDVIEESTARDEADQDHDEITDDHADEGTHDRVVPDDVDVDRVIEIAMEDIMFSVEELEFAVGERVRFVFENVGAAPHEALIGDMHVQDEHEQQMMEGDGHHDGGHHGDLSMISLESGESGSIVHEFTEAGELWMGCHVPGHWDAGMRTRITVTG